MPAAELERQKAQARWMQAAAITQLGCLIPVAVLAVLFVVGVVVAMFSH